MAEDFKSLGERIYKYALSQFHLYDQNQDQGLTAMTYAMILICLHQKIPQRDFFLMLDAIKKSYKLMAESMDIELG